MKKLVYEQECPSCHTMNPLYRLSCSNCSTILHNKVPNIDLWKTLLTLVESPGKAFTEIVRAQKKNYMLFLLAFYTIKMYFDALLVKIHVFKIEGMSSKYTLLLVLGITVLFIVTCVLYKFLLRIVKVRVRIKDVVSGMSFAQFPLMFAFIVLFIPEFIFFGEYLFSCNPSPFLFNATLAWMFTGLEALAILWTILLQWRFLTFINGRRLLSLLLSLVFTGINFSILLSTIIWLKYTYGN
jgi:hypothetical protein